MTRVRTKFLVALFLSIQLVAATQTATMARAEMIGTQAAIERHAAKTDRAFLLGELQRDEVRQEIIARGIDPAEAEARLAALSDAEVARLAAEMEEGVAGAGIVGTLATVFLILLLTDILCLTNLFSFTRCAR